MQTQNDVNQFDVLASTHTLVLVHIYSVHSEIDLCGFKTRLRTNTECGRFSFLFRDLFEYFLFRIGLLFVMY